MRTREGGDLDALRKGLYPSPGPALWPVEKCVAALVRQPHRSIAPAGQCWRSLFSQQGADAVRLVDLQSIRTCHPQNFAYLVYACAEQLWLYTEYVAAVLDVHTPDVRLIRAVLREARVHHTAVYNALDLLERCLRVLPVPHPTIDFADAMLMKNKTLEDRGGDAGKAFLTLGGAPLENTLGYVIVSTMLRLLHCPDLTVDVPTVDGLSRYVGNGAFNCEGTGLSSVAERDLLWRTFADRTGFQRFKTARLKILRGALATLVPQGAAGQAPFTQPLFYRLWTEPGVPLQHRGTLFGSLLNVVCGWDPVGEGLVRWVPWVADATRDRAQVELVEYALHLLLALLQHAKFFSAGAGEERGAGQVRLINDVVAADCFRGFLVQLGSAASKDLTFVANAFLARLRVPLAAEASCWTTAPRPEPFVPELLLLVAHLVETSHDFRLHLCAEETLFPTVELLLCHLASALGDRAKERDLEASCCLNTLLHLTTESALTDGLQRPWGNSASLPRVLASAAAAAGKDEPNLLDPATPYMVIEVVYLAMADVLLSDLPWLRERTVCYDMAAMVLLNLSPYLCRPSLVVCDRLAALLDVFSFPAFLHDPMSTNFYFVCLLLEVYYYALAFNWKANEALVRSLLRRKETFEALFSAIGAEQRNEAEAAPQPGNTPTLSPTPAMRHYTRENWQSRALLKPLVLFLRSVDAAYRDRFRGADDMTDGDVLTWLRAYLGAPKGAVDLFTLAKGAHFQPAVTATPLQYALQDRFTWALLAAPRHYPPLCDPQEVVMLKVGLRPAHP